MSVNATLVLRVPFQLRHSIMRSIYILCLFSLLGAFQVGCHKKEEWKPSPSDIMRFESVKSAFLSDIAKLQQSEVPAWRRHFWRIVGIFFAVLTIVCGLAIAWGIIPSTGSGEIVLTPCRLALTYGAVAGGISLGAWISGIAVASLLIGGGSYLTVKTQRNILYNKLSHSDVIAIDQRISNNRDSILSHARTNDEIADELNRLSIEALKARR